MPTAVAGSPRYAGGSRCRSGRAGARAIRVAALLAALGLPCVLITREQTAAGARTPAPRVSTRDPGSLTISSPGPGALVTGQFVTVRVRTRQSAPRLDVRLYGKGDAYRNVSARFHRSGPGRFVARLGWVVCSAWGSIGSTCP